MGKVEQGIEEWQHAVSQHEDTARRGNGGIAEHGWVLRLRRGRGREEERGRGGEEKRGGGNRSEREMEGTSQLTAWPMLLWLREKG